MSSRTVFALLALLHAAAVSAPAQDWERIAAASDRGEDPTLVRLMRAQDLEAQLAVCRGLGRRRDANVQAVLESLAAACSPATAARTELLLRWVLFSARSNQADFRAWAAANQPSMDGLLRDMGRWRTPMLKMELIDVALVERGPVSRRAIAEAGAGIVSGLESTAGLLTGEETALALAFLNAARQIGSEDLLSPCSDIARLSRDKTVVDAAREVAAALAR